MIQPLRNVHRRGFVALAFILPAVLAAGLGARRPSQPSRAHIPQLPSSARLLKQSDTLWQRHAIATEFFTDTNDPEKMQVVLHLSQDPNEPDLLLYWSMDQPSGDSLPTGAQLLGSYMADNDYSLPANVGKGGYLLLYSLAHQSLYDFAAVEKRP
jgi:hypothetical protein